MNTDSRYPIGRFDPSAGWTPGSRRAAIADILGLPANLRRALDSLGEAGLDQGELDTPYRPDGWTVRQLVHHLADAQITGYVRMKLALTEENPPINPYDESAWALLPDYRLPIAPSLAIIDAVTERWAALCDALNDGEVGRTYTHAVLGPMTLDAHLHFFGWHARHHTAQIAGLRTRVRP